jgi:hypothetical protein
MGIPIVINNLNRYTTTKNLYEHLLKLNYNNISIIDNGSTSESVLNWYYWSNIPLISKSQNLGHLAIYSGKTMQRFRELGHKYVVYTDSDIELNPDTPENFIELIIELMEKYNINKGGLALKIDDLPLNEFTPGFKDWESKYWINELEPNVYKAELDTTFCVIRTDLPFQYEAIRVAGEMTAKHIPWYTDFSNLNEEEQYYLDHVTTVSSGYKRYYNLYLKNNNNVKPM